MEPPQLVTWANRDINCVILYDISVTPFFNLHLKRNFFFFNK